MDKNDLEIQIRNSMDLRSFLLKCMTDLRAKRISPAEARAQGALARSVIDTARLEIYNSAHVVRDHRPIDLLAVEE